MNREIKFKFFDIKNKHFPEVPYWRYTICSNGQIYDSENDEYTKAGERFIPLQYINVKDVFDVELYEADIIEFTDDFGETHKAAIQYVDCKYCVIWGEDNLTVVSDIYAPKKIGNLYEHPELLTTTL